MPDVKENQLWNDVEALLPKDMKSVPGILEKISGLKSSTHKNIDRFIITEIIGLPGLVSSSHLLQISKDNIANQELAVTAISASLALISIGAFSLAKAVVENNQAQRITEGLAIARAINSEKKDKEESLPDTGSSNQLGE